MINTFSPHMEVLPPEQKQLWPQLASAPRLGLVLYGGTSIALQLGHRSSVDFDFFTEHPLDRAQILDSFSFLKNSTLLQVRPDTLTFAVSSDSAPHPQVKVSFFGGIGHGRVGQPRETDDGVLRLASLDDLMAMKLKTILQRIEAKDYRDIAAMVKAGISLSRGLASASRLYGSVNFQPAEAMKALVYFEGGDLRELSTEERRMLIHAVDAVRELPPVAILNKSLTIP